MPESRTPDPARLKPAQPQRPKRAAGLRFQADDEAHPRPFFIKAKTWVSIGTLALGAVSIGGITTAATPANGIQSEFHLAGIDEIDIRIGRNTNASRVEIYGKVGSRASIRREGNVVIVRLPGETKPDIGSLRANLPVGVSAVDLKVDNRANNLIFTLKDKTDAHFGRSDGAVYIQIDTAKAEAASDPLSVSLQAQNRSSESSSLEAPKPVLPQLDLSVQVVEGGTELDFPFSGPVGAAMFQRGEYVWIVYDQEIDIRFPPGLKGHGMIEDVDIVRNDGLTAMRIRAPSAGSLSAASEGAVWRVRLGGTAIKDAKVSNIALNRDDTSGTAQINANLSGVSRIAWIRDPSVGDRMAIALSRGPVKQMLTSHESLDVKFATTAHGVVLEHLLPDIKVAIDGDLVQVSRPGGLILSSLQTVQQFSGNKMDKLEFNPGPYPSVPDMEKWGQAKGADFLPAYNRLQVAAADEAQGGADISTKARLSLARFLIGHELAYEAQGVLDLLIRKNPRAGSDPYVRGLRAFSKILTRRYKQAGVDLESPALALDPSARLWRGYIAARDGRYTEARKDFADGARALDSLPSEWRVRMASANANAAVETGDLNAARQSMHYAMQQRVEPLDRLESLLVAGKILEANGDKQQALGVYSEISKASLGRIATPAMLNAARLKLDLGQATASQTVGVLDGLRFRWRGDSTEMDIISSMGDIFLKAGRYREALNALKNGGQRFFDRPQAATLNNRLNTAFRALFLDGMADGLQPIEALSLFYDFQSLTPPGSDGDFMVRKLARRLVDVDLLSKASELLNYQVDNRLQGLAKAEVASDLAAIQLMNREPEKALQSLWKTRTTLLPKPLLAQRRVLEARALNDLGRTDQAMETLGTDTSPEALDLRGEILWRQKNWAQAAALFEKRLGERWKQAGNLSLEDEGRLIKAGVGFSLISDQAGLQRLSERFGKFIPNAQAQDALRVALAGMDSGPVTGRDFALAAAQADAFAGWVANMKKKLRDHAISQPTPAKGLAK